MDEEKEIEIVLDDPKSEAEAKKDEPVVIVEDHDTPAVEMQENEESPQEVLKKMQKKLEQTKRKAEKFEREKIEAETRARHAMQEAGENRKHVMMAALNQVKNDADLLQAQFAEAMSLNNFELAGKIQSQIAANEVRKVQFESELESMKRQDTASQSGSQLDQIINSVSPTSAKWLKANRDHLDSDKSIRRMFRAHEDAVEDGIKPDSDEYFEFIEKRLGISEDDQPERQERQPNRRVEAEEDDEPMSAAAKPKQKSPPPPPAPVERYSSRPNVIKLSRDEAEHARMFGMTEKEYAMHKLALQKEGKMSR